MADVLVVGSYNAGFTVYTEHLPRPGETVGDGRFEWGPGGKGANQAVGVRRLGIEACFVTKLGNDVFGEDGRRVLRAEGLPEWGLLAGHAATGVAFILVQDNGENSIVVAPGANAELDIADVVALEAHIGRSSLVLLQLECRAELAIDVGRWAQASGRRCILNPAPARPLPADALANLDVLTPNETELASLASWLGLAPAPPDVHAMALVELGVRDVVVTLGDQGVLWATKGHVERFPAYPVTVVDTTGAGDAFTAGLVTGLARGESMAVAIDLGCRAGAYCVTKAGVIDGLGRLDDLAAIKP